MSLPLPGQILKHFSIFMYLSTVELNWIHDAKHHRTISSVALGWIVLFLSCWVICQNLSLRRNVPVIASIGFLEGWMDCYELVIASINLASAPSMTGGG